MSSSSSSVVFSWLLAAAAVAAMSSASCRAPVADDTASFDNALNGGATSTDASACGATSTDASDVADATDAAVDPFDPASCAGSGMDAPTARTRWGIADGAHVLGRYTVTRRTRTLGYGGVWGPWVVSPGLFTRPLAGTVSLAITRTDQFHVALVDDADNQSGIAGGSSYGYLGSLSYGSYFYEVGTTAQPRNAPLEFSIDGSSPLRQAHFTGRLTSQCIRLVAHHETSAAQEEIVAYGALTPTIAPPFKSPNHCFLSGPSVDLKGCGGNVGATSWVCCPAGTSTCFTSGCRCVSTC